MASMCDLDSIDMADHGSSDEELSADDATDQDFDAVSDRTSTPSQGASKSTQPNRQLFSTSGALRDPLRNLSNTHLSSSADPHSRLQKQILEELRKTNSRLDTFSDQLEAMDGRLKSVEQMQLNSATPTSSSDSSTSKTKRKVPAKVAMTVRDVYKALLDEDENFTGYDTNKRFTEKHNQDVVSRLVSEAGKLDTNVPVIQLRDAARRFYQTNIETTALKDKGKYDAKVTQQRRRNRLKRKLDSRQSVILKSSSVTDAQKDALKKVLLREFMSSEESGEEVVDGEKRSVLLVKPLPWRASKLDRIFKQIDHKANKNKQNNPSNKPYLV